MDYPQDVESPSAVDVFVTLRVHLRNVPAREITESHGFTNGPCERFIEIDEDAMCELLADEIGDDAYNWITDIEIT